MRRSARGGEGVRRGRPFSAVCRALPRREHVECSAVAYGVWWDAWRPPQSVPFWVSKQVWGAAAAGGENGERHVKEHVEECIVASRTGDAGGRETGTWGEEAECADQHAAAKASDAVDRSGLG